MSAFEYIGFLIYLCFILEFYLSVRLLKQWFIS